MKRKFSLYLGSIFSFLLLMFLVIHSRAAAQASLMGLKLCATTLIPSLFPFMVISQLIANSYLMHKFSEKITPLSKKLFGFSGTAIFSFLIGLLGSYPGGIKNLMAMYSQGIISKQEAKRAALFCNNTGAAFCIAYMGGFIFSSLKIGVFLYFIHVLSALMLMIIARSKLCFDSPKVPDFKSQNFATVFTSAIKSGAETSLFVCGFVVFFSVLTEVLKISGIFYSLSGFLASNLKLELKFTRAFILGFMELSSGSTALLHMPINSINISLGSFMLSWGGLCVQAQSSSILMEEGFSPFEPIIFKLIQAVISFFLAYVLFPLFF